jgi:integrase
VPDHEAAAKAESQDRVLTDNELARVWQASIAQSGTFGVIARLLMLTAQRRGEVSGIGWDEIDALQGVWIIPGSRTKNHKAHALPLCATAVDIPKSRGRASQARRSYFRHGASWRRCIWGTRRASAPSILP